MTVKFSARFVLPLASILLLGGCDIGVLDNYDEPTSVLKGQVVFEGVPVGVRSNGVQLELWQPGFALSQKIPIYVDQDGSFSVVVFDGSYKLNLLPGNGPWADIRDTVQVQLNRSATVEVPVVPFYTINDATVGSRSGGIEASFRVRRIDDGRALEYVGLYVATTAFVDRTNMAVRTEQLQNAIPSLDDPINLRVELPANLAQRKEVYVRIGVKTVGVAEMLFSPVHKVAL